METHRPMILPLVQAARCNSIAAAAGGSDRLPTPPVGACTAPASSRVAFDGAAARPPSGPCGAPEAAAEHAQSVLFDT
jgi:hypothetical protein